MGRYILALLALAGCATTKPCQYFAERPEGERYSAGCYDPLADAKARELGEKHGRFYEGPSIRFIRAADEIKR